MIPAVEVRDEQTSQLLGLADWWGPIPGPLAEIRFAIPTFIPNYFSFPQEMPPVYWEDITLRWEQFCVGHGRLTYWVLATSRAKYSKLVRSPREFRGTQLRCHPLDPHPDWAWRALCRYNRRGWDGCSEEL